MALLLLDPPRLLAALFTFVAASAGAAVFVAAGQRRAKSLGLGGERWFAVHFPWTAWIEPGAMRAAALFAVSGPVAGTALIALGHGGLPGVLVTLGGPLVGGVLARSREKHWEERFGEMLPNTAIRIADTVRAGVSLPVAVERVGADAAEPVRSVLILVVQAHNDGGLPFAQALDGARQRVASRELALVFEALALCYRKGGPLPEVLERISASLRELGRIRAKVLSSTAGARLGIQIMLATPVAMLFLLRFLEPDSIDLLTTTVLGWIVLGLVGGMVGISFLWSRSILRQYL